jgi:hypothetical protein
MMLGTQRSNDDDERSIFQRVDTFRMVKRLGAFSGQVQKPRIAYSKIGLLSSNPAETEPSSLRVFRALCYVAPYK